MDVVAPAMAPTAPASAPASTSTPYRIVCIDRTERSERHGNNSTIRAGGQRGDVFFFFFFYGCSHKMDRHRSTMEWSERHGDNSTIRTWGQRDDVLFHGCSHEMNRTDTEAQRRERVKTRNGALAWFATDAALQSSLCISMIPRSVSRFEPLCECYSPSKCSWNSPHPIRSNAIKCWS